MSRLLTLLLCLLATTGCTGPARTYAASRLGDLTDVAHFDVSGISFAAFANVGPFMLGFDSNAGLDSHGGGARDRWGLGGRHKLYFGEGDALGLVLPLSWQTVRSRESNSWLDGQEWQPKLTWYNKIEPGLASAGVHVGFGIGIGFAVDVVEFADFVLGLFTVDLLQDDRPALATEEAAGSLE